MKSRVPARSSRGPVRDVPHYLRTFQAYIGARMYVVFALTLLAALAEGLGIVMLLPLLQSLDGMQMEAPSGIGQVLANVLGWLGLADSMVAVLLIIGSFFLLKGLFLFLASSYKVYLRAQLMRELKGQLFDHYSRMSYLHYVSRDTGHFINIINGQINGFLAAFGGMLKLGTTLIKTAIYFGLAFVVAWRFGLMAVVLGGILLVLFRWLNLYVRTLSRQSSREAGHLSKLLIQSLQAFKYLASTAQGGHLRTGVMASIRRLTGYQARLGIAASFTQSIREPIAVTFVILIVLAQLVWFEQPLGPMIVSILLFYRGLGAVLSIQKAWQKVVSRIGSLELVRDEFNEQIRQREPDGTREIGPLTHGVELRDVHFAYNKEHGDVLAGVSLTIPVRTSVALVGESGAGKSTLVDLLTAMLKPYHGQVMIDGVSGEEIQLASWRRQIGYVSQETVVFDDTIANNICLWQGDVASDEILFERVREAARQAHIAHFIEEMPNAYHTRVGDRGVRLSGGQRQRLFIARELFKRPNLLILDEATSALDSESERAIQQSIDELKGRITVVIIAHRLATIRNVDYVYVLDKGRIIEGGTYDVLRNTENSRFSGLVAMQRL